MSAATKMRHELDRIMLEGNTEFQQLRLRADALEEENKRLREALQEAHDALNGMTPNTVGLDNMIRKALEAK